MIVGQKHAQVHTGSPDGSGSSGRLGYRRTRTHASLARFCRFACVLLWCVASVVHAAGIDLTDEERQWLRSHPTITVAAYEGGWPPFERYENETLTGLAPAYLDEIARQLGVRVAVRRYPSWEEALKGGCRREVDVLMDVSLVPERTPCLVFTTSYVEAAPVAVGRANRSDLLAPDRLTKARIVVDRGASVERATLAQFPNAQVIAVVDTQQALQAVQNGKADLFIGNPYVARSALATGAWPALAVLAPIDLPADTLHFAVPDDRKPLASAIDKALANITPGQRVAFERKWLGTSSGPIQREGRIPLTNDEQTWLAGMPPPRLGYTRTWEPISFPDEKGHVSGIAGEYVRMMERGLGMRLQKEVPASLEDLLDLMKRGQLDVVPIPAAAPIGPQWKMTDTFARVGTVVITRNGSRMVSGLGDLDGKRIAVVGTGRAAKVKAEAPGATLLLMGNNAEGLKAVQDRQADAYVGDIISSERSLRSGDFTDLRIAAPAGFDDELVFAIRGEYQPLVPLINRMLASLNHEDQQRIRSQWLEVQVSSGVRWRTVAMGAGVAALLLAILTLAWLRTRHEIQNREKTDSLMRDLTRNLPGVIFKMTRDPAGNYALPFIAGNTRALFGMGHDELMADPKETLPSCIYEPDMERMRRAMAHSYEELTPVEMDFRTVSPAPERWVRVSAVARRLPDGLVHWSGYWVDVTAAHRQADALESAKESAESAAAARANFLAAMSHEIRTPMAGITGIIEILSRSEVNEDQRYLLGLVQDYAQALRTILDDVLDISRMEAGRLALEPVDTDLRVLVSNSIELVLDLCRRKNLRCICHIDPSLAGVVVADPTRLRQILLNLLSNAIKFTSSGYVAVSLQVLETTKDAQTWCLAVTDTGIGIGAAEQGRLFQPFTQAEASTSRTYGGSGLGLAICRRLADLMRATLELHSAPGEGTRVALTIATPIARQTAIDVALAGRSVLVRSRDADTAEALTAIVRSFGAKSVADIAQAQLLLSDDPPDTGTQARWVPLVEDSSDAPRSAIVTEPLLPTHVRRACVHALDEATTREPSSMTAKASHAARILVAEDHSTNQLLVQRQLAELGYRCRVASDGEQALAALAEDHFDLLLTDLRMPGMSGFELARAVRARELTLGLPRLPVLALSAGVGAEDEAQCRDAGMDDHLRKPIGLDEMKAQLERWLPPEPAANDATADETLTGTIAALVESAERGEPPQDIALPPLPPVEAIDLAMLTRSFGSRETVCLVAEDLLANLPADLDELRSSDEARDAKRMGRALHRITGALGTFGYRNLAGDLRVASRTAEAGNLLTSEEIALLLRRVDRTLSELGTFVSENRTNVD